MIKLNSFIRSLNNGNYIADENLNNSFFSGNKIRKLKYLLEKENLKGLMTLGSEFSSHCLATSYYAHALNIPCILIVISDNKIDPKDYPHLYLATKLGATIHFVDSKNATAYIDLKKEEHRHFCWIPGGGHTLEAMRAYEDYTIDLFTNELGDERIENILIPFGTGTTAIGIYSGIEKLGKEIKIIGVTVARNRERCIKSFHDFNLNPDSEKFQLIEDYVGKYGKGSPAIELARSRFFKDTGILLDPIYNSKVVECFYRYNFKNTLILNTGGMLNNIL